MPEPAAADRIRKLLDTASRPPWWINDGHMVAALGQDEDGEQYWVGTPNAMAAEASCDAALVAELRTHADALLDVVDAADGAVTFEGPDGTPFCPVCDDVPEACDCELRHVRAALARLDGEDTG